VPANPTRLAFAGESVSVRTSSGNATDETADPTAETTCPLQTSRKSRLRWSGVTTASHRVDHDLAGAAGESVMDEAAGSWHGVALFRWESPQTKPRCAMELRLDRRDPGCTASRRRQSRRA